jgi:uncharacterized protein YndB with AHSA1/START domain
LKVRAARELLAPREDVWAFLAEPYHLRDWWPGIAGVQPDRRGAASGARWQVIGGNEPSLFRRPRATDTLLVTAAEEPRRFAFHLTGDRLSAEVALEVRSPSRTVAVLTIEGPVLIGPRRSLARRALSHLYSLCQTAAEL